MYICAYMQVSEFKDQLLFAAGVKPERVMEFSCGNCIICIMPSTVNTVSCYAGHVIPPDNLLPVTLCKGPGGVDFEFTFQRRNDPKLVSEL